MNQGSRQIDGHVHFWQLARGDYDWMTPDLKPLCRDFTPDDLLPHLKSTAVKEVVIVQAAATIAETDFILDIAQETDFVSGVVGWVDMQSPTVDDDLERLCANPYFKGIRPMIQDITDVDWMLRDELAPAFNALTKRGLVFDCLVKPQHLPNLATLLARYPELGAIINHGAKPQIAACEFEQWALDMKKIAQETNAYCKLSGLVTEAGDQWSIKLLRPYVDHLLDCFGPNRLVFGSDWPVVTLAANYNEWRQVAEDLTAGLDEKDRAKIFGDNAAAFYNL